MVSRGEILTIQLGDVREHSALIDKRVYKCDLDTPKGAKGTRWRVRQYSRLERVGSYQPGAIVCRFKAQLPFPTEKNTPPAGQYLKLAHGAQTGEGRAEVGVPKGSSARTPVIKEGSQKVGAGDGIRTRDVQLGKLAFYH